MGSKDAFKHFNRLVECTNDAISMKWITYLNIKIDHLTFELKGQHIWVRYKDHATFEAFFVVQIVYAKAMVEVEF